jgi:hypothetical protein
MSEPSDPVEKLRRFTVATGTLNRDELLFQAARASVRTPWLWKWSACLLALSQTVTLALWLAVPLAPRVPPRPADVAPQPAVISPGQYDDASLLLGLGRTVDLDQWPASPVVENGEPLPEIVLSAAALYRGEVLP